MVDCQNVGSCPARFRVGGGERRDGRGTLVSESQCRDGCVNTFRVTVKPLPQVIAYMMRLASVASRIKFQSRCVFFIAKVFVPIFGSGLFRWH